MTNHEYGVSAFDANAMQATIRSEEVNELVKGLRKEGGTFKDIALVATADTSVFAKDVALRGVIRSPGKTSKDCVTMKRSVVPHSQSMFTVSQGEPAFRLTQRGGNRAKPYDIPYQHWSRPM